MAAHVNITSNGIQKVLRNYTEKQALAEYIWNGFDARADTIEINFNANPLGFIDHLEVVDNGYGIDFDHLVSKFNPFYESEKALQLAVNRNKSVMHGKNGVGRLTFFRLANDAEWTTTFKKGSKFVSGKIGIGVGSLNSYQSVIFDQPIQEHTGTTVRFLNLKINESHLLQEIIPYLKSEFCWFLELNKKKNYRILINGILLDYETHIADYQDDMILRYEDTNTTFRLKFVQWNESLHKELSKAYFINEKLEEVHKEYTTLNKKADEYYHSIYIESEFFSEFDFSGTEFEMQANLYSRSKSAPEYKFLIKKVNELLQLKRKAFLKEHSGKLLERYEKEGVFSGYDETHPERKHNLLNVLKSLYEIQPKLFSNLSIDQKKILVRLLDTVLISDQRAGLIDTIAHVVTLEDDEKTELSVLLAD
ncbi:ATP-binding protein [Pedobacter sp. MC2016-24]|uniref:ATP-binding protein n=1 Tax=Pedobacter sp. MC2016-24 TaxID=2780090 RepID=UPI00187F2802|nr:ATP-binding protein [Pedobacter sp. MC2016-24]MBE9598276.1 ATP-binding protein [Pedobacter sp. MC2016-24]